MDYIDEITKLYDFTGPDGVFYQQFDAEGIVAIFPNEAQGIIFSLEKAVVIVAVHDGFDTAIEALTGNASIPERDTWKSKEDAARALIGGTASESQTQMIGIEAQYLGVGSTALAQIIIGKADAFQMIAGLAAGVRGKTIAAIEAAASAEDLALAVQQGKDDMAQAMLLVSN